MKRILIIGSSGAGKSTVARRLGAATGIEVVHLDRLYWKPNWIETEKAEWRAILVEILRNESWIMDGNYSGTLDLRIERADAIMFLDFPRAVCVFRVLKRLALYRKTKRPDMADDCAERFDWNFIKWVWNYPTRSKPKVEAMLKRFENEKKIIHLKSKKDVENYFERLRFGLK